MPTPSQVLAQIAVIVQTTGPEGSDPSVEMRQSAEILIREFKARGLAAIVLSTQNNSPIEVKLSDDGLRAGFVELKSSSLNRAAHVDLENAVELTVEWINEINTARKSV